MVRFRRIENRDRIFFLTTNLARGVTYLQPAERDWILMAISEERQRGSFLLFGYVVMPDHLHLLLAPLQRDLIRIVRDLKSKTGFQLNRARGRRGAIWQERYFDHILRRVQHFWEKLEYIHQNPVEAQLVRQPEDWPWSSYRHYIRQGSPPVVPDPVELPADGNTLLWPAPWR